MLTAVSTPETTTVVPQITPIVRTKTVSIDGVTYYPLYIEECRNMVTRYLRDGYRDAYNAYYTDFHCEYGPEVFPTTERLQGLVLRHMPRNLLPECQFEWERGFVSGWVNASLGIEEGCYSDN